MSASNNVVLFPVERRTAPPQSLDEVEENLDFYRICHIQDSLEMIVPTLFNQISMLGFNNFSDDADVSKLGAMIVESIRAYMCHHHGIEHQFHEIASKAFQCNSNGDILIDESLKVTFNKNKDNNSPDGKKTKK